MFAINKVINASAAATLLSRDLKKNSGSERDSNPRPLRCRLSSQTELPKPLESGRIRVNPLYVDVLLGSSMVKSEMIYVHYFSSESRSEPEFFSGLCSSSFAEVIND